MMGFLFPLDLHNADEYINITQHIYYANMLINEIFTFNILKMVITNPKLNILGPKMGQALGDKKKLIEAWFYASREIFAISIFASSVFG